MTRYSDQPSERIFVKGSRFKYWYTLIENVDKKISKNLSGKYIQKRLDYAKQSAANALETSPKIAIQKTVEKTRDLTGNIFAVEITKVSRTLPRSNADTVTNEKVISRLDK